MMTVQSDKPLPVSQTNQNPHANIAAQAANNLDSLSNSTLSQGTWFITMTTQLDALATRQNKLELQTSHQLSTIMAQLETIHTLMEDQRWWQDEYNGYDGYDHNHPFTPEQPNMDEDINDTTNKRLTAQAASNSHMEDASNLK